MMSFRNFVRRLDDTVDGNTAFKKYNDYMANLSQSKVGRFFEVNKDREWFRLKYHPIESQRTLHKQNVNFMKRLKIFNDLNERGYLDRLTYTAQNISAILNLMNAVIVQLEDGPQELVESLLSCDVSNIDNELKKYIPTHPTSVLIDDVNIETTSVELEEFCKAAHPDLLRIAQLSPYYIEDGILRRKIIAVYANHVNIRDVCWKLSRTKLHNRLLNVTIIRPLQNRVLTVDATSNHHICILDDIRYATILILNFDELKGLYGKRKQLLETFRQQVNEFKADIGKENNSMQVDNDTEDINGIAPPSPPGSETSGGKEETNEKPFDVNSLDEEREKEKKKLFEYKFNLQPSSYRLASKLAKSKNPLLSEEVHTYFVDVMEATQAEYYLNRVCDDLKSDNIVQESDNNKQEKLAILNTTVKNLPYTVEESSRFLDRLLWYLRIVHSFDYYKKALYKQEDELTLRMSVIHVRDDPKNLPANIELHQVCEYLQKNDREYEEFGLSQSQRFVTKDEERYNYKSYGKVITDELTSYAQRVQKGHVEAEEVYKCRHCTRVFQKLGDIGRHFVTKHRWAVDAIELETDFFNAYLFDATKMDPSPPKHLIDRPPNRFAKLVDESNEDLETLQQSLEVCNKMVVKEPAPRAQVEGDPRNSTLVNYEDISFDDAI